MCLLTVFLSAARPLVIVNSLCPGPVATDLSRDLTGKNPLLRPLLLIFQATQTVGPDYGSRIYITTSKAGGIETHVSRPTLFFFSRHASIALYE